MTPTTRRPRARGTDPGFGASPWPDVIPCLGASSRSCASDSPGSFPVPSPCPVNDASVRSGVSPGPGPDPAAEASPSPGTDSDAGPRLLSPVPSPCLCASMASLRAVSS